MEPTHDLNGIENLVRDQIDNKDCSAPNPFGILPNDHPLLQRFQQALKVHLERVEQQLLSEITDIDYNIKKNETDREEIGSKLYDMQQEIMHQNKLLENCIKETKDLSENRKKFDESATELNNIHKDHLVSYKNAKNSYNAHLIELKNLQHLESHIKTWSKEMIDDVIVAKRVYNKDLQTQKAISEEKKQMDLLIFNLESEVRAREDELRFINEQIEEQTENVETQNKRLSDATADLEALQQDIKRLNQSWGEVIIAIAIRDKVLLNTKTDLNNQKENFRLVSADIQATKKSAGKEMEKNEKLEMQRTKTTNEVNTLESQVQLAMEEINKLDSKLNSLAKLLEQTEIDFNEAKTEGTFLENTLRTIENKYIKLLNKRIELEENILQIAQDQMVTDKANEHRMKLIRTVQSQRRDMEITLAQTENQISTILLELEKLRGAMLDLKEDRERLNKRFTEVNDYANSLIAETKDIDNTVVIRSKNLENLNNKLGELTRKLGSAELSPLDRKIITLEGSIREYEQQITELQKVWLTHQNNFNALSDKRNQQLNELQTIRKHLLIIGQKGIKINAQLEEANNMNNETCKNIDKLILKIELTGDKVYDKKKSFEIQEALCEVNHAELIEKLKESERSVLKLEQEIIDINKENELLNTTAIEMHRESLSWETKYKLVEDMARKRYSEYLNSDEMKNIRIEIHRMKIRNAQLQRAQEKLIQDLEQCVVHRENIFDAASNRRKTQKEKFKSRSMMEHKLNEVNNKLKQCRSEIINTENNNIEANEKYLKMLAENTKKQEELDYEKLQLELIENEVDDGNFLKLQNLENIVRRQKRVKKFKNLLSLKHKYKGRPSDIMDREMIKHKEVNENLISIVKNLINEFPEKRAILTRIQLSLEF